MMDISKGRYWDKPWSLVDGCTPCSPGCDHCWSAAMTHRFNFQWTKDGKPEFNGHITVRPERLNIPLKRRKPTVYAVWNDLFHEAVPEIFISQALAVTAGKSPHTFLILTKRPKRMADYFDGEDFTGLLRNVWFGLTVCNQQEADEKIPIFLQVPGKKFLNIEPMLSAINFRWQPYCYQAAGETYRQYLERNKSIDHLESLKGIGAVILGGETGPGARPMHPDWVRSVRDQCQSAGVPFFFKQWGGYLEGVKMSHQWAKILRVEKDDAKRIINYINLWEIRMAQKKDNESKR